MESFGEFGAHAERPLRSSPDREFVAIPFGYRCAWFQRRVRYVLDGVGLLERPVSRRQTVSHRPLRPRAPTATFTAAASLVCGRLAQHVEQFFVRRLPGR